MKNDWGKENEKKLGYLLDFAPTVRSVCKRLRWKSANRQADGKNGCQGVQA